MLTFLYFQELNPSVEVGFVLRSAEDLIAEDDLKFLFQFTVVVGSNLQAEDAAQISDYLYKRNIPFVYARAYGLTGYVRVCVREHTIFNSHEENVAPDLRLDRPFPALIDLVEATDLDAMDYEAHSHTPYLILYLKALDLWREKYGKDDFPDNYAKRKTFEEVCLQVSLYCAKFEITRCWIG
ncbi:unnamed protein product [Gongylonema pulchrum]|uniref:Phosphorylase b kinase regulatory subunit n=1 Tax=Gongylonema pulchrum TaxID=637853 RepID=A0A183ETM6_9BILA|nr:unnamed protein product [Gongylonema pulchrum]